MVSRPPAALSGAFNSKADRTYLHASILTTFSGRAYYRQVAMAIGDRLLWHRLLCGHDTISQYRFVAHLCSRSTSLIPAPIVSAPFRGTQLVYTLGEDICNAPTVRPFSAGDIMAKGVHLAAYFAPVLPRFLDVHADARGLSFRQASFLSFLRQLRKSDWAGSRDVTPYDVTFESADERESRREGEVHPRTYYRSYCATLVSAYSYLGLHVLMWGYTCSPRLPAANRLRRGSPG